MIDTIFYFVETDAEYQLKRALGEISNKTIVFVEDTREIYLNGRGYGKTSTAGLVSDSEFTQWKNTIQGLIDSLSTEAALNDQDFADRLERELNAAKQELQDLIQLAKDKADAVEESLTSFTENLNGDIQSAITDAITNSNGRTIWTEINNTNNAVSTVTNKVDNILDSDGNIKYTVLQAAISSGIDGNQAFTDISSRWAVASENQEVLEWMASGFKTLTQEGDTFAAMYSADKTATGNAIALAKTEVLGDVESGYVSKLNLSTGVIDTIKDNLSITSLADIALQSDITSASTSLTTAFNDSLTLIQQKSTEQDARLDLLTTVTTPAGSQNSVIAINEANLDAAMARILATNGSSAASQVDIIATGSATGIDIQSSIDSAVATAVSGMATTAYVDGAENRVSSYLKDGSGNIITSASLQNAVTTDHATLTALATTVDGLLTAQAGMVTTTGLGSAMASLIASNSDVKSAITTYVNGSNSNITLTADKIYLDATNTLANTILATQGNIGGYNISSNGLEATNTTTGNGISITTDHIQTLKNNVPKNSFSADGSGFIAGGAFSWNNNGVVTMSQEFLAALFAALGNGATNNLAYSGVSESMYNDYADQTASTEASVIAKRAHIGSTTTTVGLDRLNSAYSGAASGSVAFPDITYCPLSDPTNSVPITSKTDAVDWYLSAVYGMKLNFVNGILASKEKVDKYTHHTRAEMISDTDPDTNIAEHIYKENSIFETDQILLSKVLEFLGNSASSVDTSKFAGYISNVTWNITKPYSVPIGQPVISSPSEGKWCVINDISVNADTLVYTLNNNKFIIVKYEYDSGLEESVWKVYKYSSSGVSLQYGFNYINTITTSAGRLLDRYYFTKYNPWA